MRTRLTDLAVRKLPLSESGQVTYWDELTPNFGVRCSTRSKSYIVLLGEKRRRKTLGRYPGLSLADARKQARQLLAASGLEADGQLPLSAAPISFAEAKVRFLEDSARRNKPRTYNDYKRLLDRHFNFVGDIQSVERKQVMKVIFGLSATPSEQSHAFVAIRTMMNWCVRHGLIEHSVVPPMKQKTHERNRVLTDGELRQIYRRAEETPFPFGPLLMLLILTGQRRTEVGQMRRSWIIDGSATFPEGFAKNKREHRFPLSPKAQAEIDALPDTGDLLFPAATNFEKPFTTFAWHKARFDEGLEEVGPYTLHDLRRTFATIHAKIGTPIHVTEKLLNHVSGTISGVAAVYNRHSYFEEMQAAMVGYDNYINNVVGSG
ncbi:site-specific integrase [Aestuariivita sp.]|uniref:tyrosine-type recombinase/integrase n=1 Tax=Aestuariivita sp. TaxID=1872407 RepID=UPI00216BB44A|nr:site-specific integrase [Aestuariivita sp.]MCE8005993.1 site-specific integrase [Aestuariivita sp.]